MAAGAIPVSEIDAYCRLFRIDDLDERADILYLVGQLDDEYLKTVSS